MTRCVCDVLCLYQCTRDQGCNHMWSDVHDLVRHGHVHCICPPKSTILRKHLSFYGVDLRRLISRLQCSCTDGNASRGSTSRLLQMRNSRLALLPAQQHMSVSVSRTDLPRCERCLACLCNKNDVFVEAIPAGET